MSISEHPHGIDGPRMPPPQGVVKVDLPLTAKITEVKSLNGNGHKTMDLSEAVPITLFSFSELGKVDARFSDISKSNHEIGSSVIMGRRRLARHFGFRRR